MRFYTRYAFLFLNLLLGSARGWAQGPRPDLSAPAFTKNNQHGAVAGTVKTSNGQPVAAATVLLPALKRGTFTDEQGQFTMKNLKAGSYTMRVSYLGQEVLEQTVVINPQETTVLQFAFGKTARQLAEVVVTDHKSLNEQPVAIGKIAIRPLDLPQSTSIIEKEVLEQQQVLRLSEALQNVNGVYQMGATGGTQEEIASRGFAFGSNNTFKNGVRYNNSVMPEASALEKVEILKGSNAILFGNVAAGGVLNLVTKKPKFENGGEISMRVGSYDFYKPALDMYGAINNSDKVAYRINTSYENAASFRDLVHAERFYVNPSLLVKAGEKTDILVEGDYLHDERTPDYGIGAINYTITNLPRNKFIGVPWAFNEVTQKSATATITHRLTANWQLRAVAGLQNYTADQYSTARPSSTNIKADGLFTRTLQRTGSHEKYYLGQLDLTGQLRTGSLQHSLLVGADVDRYRTYTDLYAIYADQTDPTKLSTSYDAVNIYSPNYYAEQRTDLPRAVISTGPAGGLTKAPINRVGFYAQDLVSISEKVKVLAGLRYSYQAARSVTHRITPEGILVPLPNATTGKIPVKQYDGAFSPRLGVVYQPLKTTALFASYANSFTPTTGVDVNLSFLPPSVIDQYEIGVKNDLFKGWLSTNVTVYKIITDNFAQQALYLADGVTPNNNTSIRELAGTTASKGLEVDIMSKSVQGFTLIGGYSYNDTKFIKSSVNVAGSRLRYNPKHTANASIFYTFDNTALKGLQAGFTSFYTGDRLAGRSTRTNVANDTWKLIPLPDYLMLDAHVGYSLQKLSFRFKLTNLLNQLSYQAHDDNSINPIAPRQFSSTIAYKF